MTAGADRSGGPVALVTGAGSGIGHGVARALALDGWRVVLNDVDAALAVAAARAIEEEAGPARVVPAAGDVADPAVPGRMVEAAARRFGRLDAVVANAGVTRFGPFLDMGREEVERVLAVNLLGTWGTVQAAARSMGAGGRIVLVTSVTGLRVVPGLAAYGATKAALVHLARVLAVELGPRGITVNAVAPGATLTDRTRDEHPDYAGAWGGLTPTGRPATPDDVAGVVRFLLGPDGGHVTGQTVVVDGGWSVGSPLPEGYG